ncbi:Iq Domain-Containing Protein F2 [Manis pentadactyla]|nr:Iq Domain-Containing Protein F2 [Manis pentadactyla]
MQADTFPCGLKNGQVCEIIIEDIDETTLQREKEKKKQKEKGQPPSTPPAPKAWREAALITYTCRERAVVKLQSLVRMCCVHWRYCQVLDAVYVIQCHWRHNCQTCAVLQGHCVVTAMHLQFHIEILNH